MKMTKLEWRYLQRIALDHPYFDTHELPLTEQEAKAIVEANVKMTGREFVDSVYEKLGMVRPKEEKKRFAWLRSIGELFTVPSIRRIAIAVLVVVLMTVFFAATPAGRAIAESVIRYIGTMLDDGRVVYNRNDNTVQMNPVFRVPDPEEGETLEQECNIIDVDSFEAFAAATGVRPKVLPYPHAKLYYDHDEFTDYLELHAEYETPKGTIITSQIWNVLDLEASTSTGFSVYDADPSVRYSIEENGWITVMKLYEDSIFRILAKDSYTAEELVNLLTIE